MRGLKLKNHKIVLDRKICLGVLNLIYKNEFFSFLDQIFDYRYENMVFLLKNIFTLYLSNFLISKLVLLIVL